MSDATAINNGQRVDVDFGFYQGRAGMVTGGDGGTRVSMTAALPRGNKEPKEGIVDGKRVLVIGVERSLYDRRFTVLLIKEAPEDPAPADPASDGGNEPG